MVFVYNFGIFIVIFLLFDAFASVSVVDTFIVLLIFGGFGAILQNIARRVLLFTDTLSILSSLLLRKVIFAVNIVPFIVVVNKEKAKLVANYE